MDPFYDRLAELNSTQRRYIRSYLVLNSHRKACKETGIHEGTPYKWLEWEAIQQLIADMEIDAIGVARTLLRELAPEAVRALKEALADKSHRVQAANSILDRGGLPAASALDITSAGEQVKAVVYIPDNRRDDRE